MIAPGLKKFLRKAFEPAKAFARRKKADFVVRALPDNVFVDSDDVSAVKCGDKALVDRLAKYHSAKVKLRYNSMARIADEECCEVMMMLQNESGGGLEIMAGNGDDYEKAFADCLEKYFLLCLCRRWISDDDGVVLLPVFSRGELDSALKKAGF